jgi:glycosyltransferase involved in cell wall biosynthesis
VVLHRCKKQSLSASFVAMLSMYYERLTRVPSRIDRFVTPSKFLKGKLVEGGFEPERITWIPNFVDLDSFGGGPEGDYFLYMGRLSFDKGLDTLIRAVAGLERGELWIAGEGPHREHLQRLTLDLGTERVKFIGYRDHAEIGRILVKAQFVVLPSRSYENLPFSIMEAFASGKPVIASNVGGIPEMVDDGVNGFLFQIGDTVALTDRIRRLIHDPALRREMGQRGREKAEEIYNRNRHYERIMEVYGEVTGKGS